MSPRARIVTLGGLGALASVGAWIWQPGRTIYTDFDRIFYLPDPDLGWRLVEPGHLALGLELVSFSVASWVVAILLSTPRKRRSLTLLAWLTAVCSWLPAAAAVAAGRFPDGARLELPSGVDEVPDGVRGGLAGLPAGHWVSVEKGRGVIARVPAGGENFDTRFRLIAPAEFRGDPSDLRQPMRFRAEAKSASADTGVDGRTKSARKYLETNLHPTIAFEMIQLEGAEPKPDGSVGFAATGELQLMGRAHRTPVEGVLRSLDAGARERLGVDARAAMVARANFSLTIVDTALQERASSFDADAIEVQVELILVPVSPPPQ